MSDKTSLPRPAKGPWLRGFRRALPILLGYVPVGIAYGILALKNGVSPANTVFMSVLVLAGASQFIAVGLLAAGAGPLAVIATTFMVNLRHLLMSAALTPNLRAWSKLKLTFFAHAVTDETFALHAAAFAGEEKPGPKECFAVNLTAHGSWVAGTILGVAAGGLVGDVRPAGLDYALPAMFIALLMAQVANLAQVLAAVFAGALSVVLLMAGLDRFHVIIATVAAATLGAGVAPWIKQRSC